jgi:hypothetical protein
VDAAARAVELCVVGVERDGTLGGFQRTLIPAVIKLCLVSDAVRFRDGGKKICVEVDKACVTAAPCLSANNVDAELIHEAAIGKIAGEQLIKLMTLGLSEKEAEEQIIKGFLH